MNTVGLQECTRDDDERVLEMLALSDDGLTMVQIAERYGTTKNAICGQIGRIRAAMKGHDTDMRIYDPNQDNTMPNRWWKKRKTRKSVK